MSYYPIFLQVEGKTALVVGGGSVAERKVETLLEFGAQIHIVSAELTQKLDKLVQADAIRYLGEEFRDEQLEGAFLVIAATDDKRLNHNVSERARRRRLLVNAVDQPEDCDFIFPSVIKRENLLIAISTSGSSPALAKRIRRKLENQFGPEYGVFLDLMGCLRKEILSEGLSQKQNSQIFHEIVNSQILEYLAKDDWEGAESILQGILPDNLVVAGIIERVLRK